MIIAGAGLLGSASSGSAQSAPNQNSYTGFVSAVAALASSADDLIASERNAARQSFIRQKLTVKVLAAFPSSDADGAKTLKLDDVLDPKKLLCDFRHNKITVVQKISTRDRGASITIDQLATMSEQNYLNGAVRQLNAAAAIQDTSDVISALKVLFAPPPAPAPATPDPSMKAVDDQKTRDDAKNSCEQDLGEFEAAYYGEPIPIVDEKANHIENALVEAIATPSPSPSPKITIPDLSFLGPIGAAISTVINIVSPVIENLAALKAGTTAAANVKLTLQQDEAKLTENGHNLARTLSDYLFAKRLSLAGQFAEQVALVQGDSIELASAEVQAACPKPYSAMYMRGPDGKGLLSPTFMRCYSAIWKHYEKDVNAALQTALAYDQAADQGNTSTAMNKFDNMTTKSGYQKILSGAVAATDPFWQEVTQLVTFAGAVVTAASSSNVKKLEQAFQAAAKNP